MEKRKNTTRNKKNMIKYFIVCLSVFSLFACPMFFYKYTQAIKENYKLSKQVEELTISWDNTQQLLEENIKVLDETMKVVEEQQAEILKLKTTIIEQQVTIEKNNVSKVSKSIATSRGKEVSRNWSDTELLARIIFAEAGGSTEEDMLLVGNVVLNRVNNPKFPNSIRDVIFAQGQYSPTWNGAIYKTPSEKAWECAKRLMDGERFCPENVVFQAQFKQGKGVWKKVEKHYYCYA